MDAEDSLGTSAEVIVAIGAGHRAGAAAALVTATGGLSAATGGLKMKKQFEELSKEISYALRHAPWDYELEIDEEGWVSIRQFLEAFRWEERWKDICESDLLKMIVNAKTAWNDGIKFYLGNENVWLADAIPGRYIEVPPI